MATAIRLSGKGISVANLMRRRAKPRFIALAIAAVIVVIYGFLGIGIFQQHQEREALLSNIAFTEQLLLKRAKQQEPLTKLEERLGAAEVRLAEARGLFPREEDGISMIRNAMAWAEGSGLKLVAVESQARRTAKLGQSTYTVLGFKLKAEGNSQQCLDYLGRLEQGPLRTLVVEQASLEMANDGYALEVDFSVYCQPIATATPPPKGPATAGPRP